MVIFRIINKINTFSAVLKFQLTEEIRAIRKFWNRSYLMVMRISKLSMTKKLPAN